MPSDGELTTADRAQNCLHRDLGVLRRLGRRHQRTSRQVRLQRGDPRLQAEEISSERPQRAVCRSMAGSLEQAEPGRVADLGHHQWRPGGPLPPNGVPAAGQPLDLLAILPGHAYPRHAVFSSSSRRGFHSSAGPPARADGRRAARSRFRAGEAPPQGPPCSTSGHAVASARRVRARRRASCSSTRPATPRSFAPYARMGRVGGRLWEQRFDNRE